MKVLYQQSISFVILTLNKELFNHLITAAVADKKHFVVIKSKEGFLLYHNRSLLRLSAIADCLFFPQTLLKKVSEQDLRFSLLCMLVEISTNLHKVSQCLEKAPTSAFSLLKAQTIAFTTIKNLC